MKKVIVVGAGFGGLNFIRNASSNKEIEIDDDFAYLLK